LNSKHVAEVCAVGQLLLAALLLTNQSPIWESI
jgi:hypothetical protein